ncbi:MAG: carboxylesterase family protein [Alphaproteobacteria bacterium]|nr:carboxylesterase family protein [Alphaproteobacteria bacterium]MDE2494032.1 carboxylesterase family protein [Alphaproteobacteria bacterium]
MGLFLAACATTLPSAVPAPISPPQVMTQSGIVQGVGTDGIDYFKGVPYAQPPVGDLRWEPPQAVAHWDGVRDASHYGHDCMQQPFPLDAAPLRTTPSEDCLYLNIWRPNSAATNLPVMVWIERFMFPRT